MASARSAVRPAVSIAATALAAVATASVVVPAPAAAAPTSGAAVTGYAGGSTNDVPHVIAEPPEVLVPEGSSRSFTVRLSHPPSGMVSVNMRLSGTGVWASHPMLLTFNPYDWSTPKSYPLFSMPDADAVDDVLVVTLDVPGYLPSTVTVRQIDDD